MSSTTANIVGKRVLVVDDDKGFRVATKTLLEDEGYYVRLCTNGDEALEQLKQDEFDIMLSDLVMEKMDGIALLQKVKAQIPHLPVIMVTGFGSIQSAVEAMKLGAADYLTKPSNNDELLIKIRRTLESSMKDRELQLLREEFQKTYTFANIVTRSSKMREIIRQIQQVANTDVTILIQGESGTGKELVARALHFTSIRKDAPFVVVNCSAVPENLLESELFGHEKGAFTGAEKRRVGKFEEAHRGTLFLDEIGDISPAVQVKLLRVLQEKQFTRLGGNETIGVDVRVAVATNRNLEVMVRQGDFREDLYYRLNVFPITLPPLRERPEDIPLLADHFLQKHSDLVRGNVKSFAPSVISEMMRYAWPGNVRELENIVKRAIIKTEGDTIASIDLPAGHPVDAAASSAVPTDNFTTSYKNYIGAILRDAEEKYLIKMLRMHKGNINQVAKVMAIDRKTVYRKLAEYSLDPTKYR
jgi:two-component system response regulator HydG